MGRRFAPPEDIFGTVLHRHHNPGLSHSRMKARDMYTDVDGKSEQSANPGQSGLGAPGTPDLRESSFVLVLEKGDAK